MSKQLLKINDICRIYEVENDFINEILEYELLTTIKTDTDLFIEEEELPVLEKIINLHYDLGVNAEGIEIIMNLLGKIEEMENEINKLKRIVKYFENDL